jgi:hypothetical protein
MTMQPVQKVPYLRVQRTFPGDNAQALSVEMSRTYVDIANKINNRTIGIFPTNSPAVNGEEWYMSGGNQKQQALRQVYEFTAATLTQPHGIIVNQIGGFVRIFGTWTDGTNWYPIPSATASVTVTPTTFVIAGIAPVSGTLVLEWLSNRLPN